MAETFGGNEFGPYIIEPTTGNDVFPFTKWFEDRHTLEESRANAVYARDIDVITDCFRRTLGILVKRKLENNKEVIVAFTGAYPITAMYAEGDQKCVLATPRIRIDEADVPVRPMEIGTTIAIPTNDVPNASGNKPRNWLFNVLIPTTVSHLFYLAGGEAGQHNLDFDVMVANVQTRLGKIQSRLEPLGWQKIRNPSLELVHACGKTTTSQSYNENFGIAANDPHPEDSIFRPRSTYNLYKPGADPNFMGQEKYYYWLPASAIANHAEHFLDCFHNKFAWGGKEERQKIHLEMRFPREMTRVMYGIIGKEYLGSKNAGHVEVRRLLFEEDGLKENDVVERGKRIYEKRKLYQSRHQRVPAYA